MSSRHSSVRKLPRQSRSRAVVDALVTATVRVVGEEGYDRASTNRIADVAGVSVGSLYQYFPNKDALVGLALEEQINQIETLVTEGFQAIAGRHIATGARELVAKIFDNHTRDVSFKAQFHELVAKVGLMDSYFAYRRDVMAVTRRYLEDHREELGRKELDVATAVSCDLVEATVDTALNHFPARLTDPAFTDDVTSMLLDYFKVPAL